MKKWETYEDKDLALAGKKKPLKYFIGELLFSYIGSNVALWSAFFMLKTLLNVVVDLSIVDRHMTEIAIGLGVIAVWPTIVLTPRRF